jgi:hypothetical protein
LIFLGADYFGAGDILRLKMAYVIASTCTQCGSVHDFYLRTSDAIDDKALYRFECPYLRAAGTISFPSQHGYVASHRTDGVVDISRVESTV